MQHGSAGKGSQLRLPHVPTSNHGLFPPSSGLAAKGPGSDVGLCTGRGGAHACPPTWWLHASRPLSSAVTELLDSESFACVSKEHLSLLASSGCFRFYACLWLFC